MNNLQQATAEETRDVSVRRNDKQRLLAAALAGLNGATTIVPTLAPTVVLARGLAAPYGSALAEGMALNLREGVGVVDRLFFRTAYAGRVISSGETVEVSGTDTGTVINSGGTTTSTTVNYGGQQHVNSSGTATNTTVSDGGWQYVYSGGTATGTTVSEGGEQWISVKGTASGITVRSGGILQLDGTGEAQQATLNSGYVLKATTSATLTRWMDRHRS